MKTSQPGDIQIDDATRTMPLSCMDTGDIARDSLGQFWVCKSQTSLLYTDELGISRYPGNRGISYDSPVTLVTPPVITTGTVLTVAYLPRSINRPSFDMIFSHTFDGWRERIHVRDYRISIPILYRSTDHRAGWLRSVWSCRGRIIGLLPTIVHMTVVGEDKPSMDIMLKGMRGSMLVPSQ